ncbi:MAG: hypothetical protein IK093_20405, partial [Ruminiclostridium sp.]|nr:hypothetical protein [Ruminiclostridium sp.]
LPDDDKDFPSQAGEGFHVHAEDDDDQSDISRKTLNTGGYMNFATTMYSAGIGPVPELMVPYEPTSDTVYEKYSLVAMKINEKGYIDKDSVVEELYAADKTTREEICKEWEAKGYEFVDGFTMLELEDYANKGNYEPLTDFKGKSVFSAVGPEEFNDWTVDEKYRFLSLHRLENGNMLPSPALADENDAYVFNQDGIDAIKSELVKGRAVTIAYCADQSMPGEFLDRDNSYMNFLNSDGTPSTEFLADIWAQYTYDRSYNPSDPKSVNKKLDQNHAVCIVGYDDNFPKEYFNDPNGTIGGDGAFIVKNSWGCADPDDPNPGILSGAWGSGGTGYFYLSYYDQSIGFAESFDFDTSEETRDVFHNVDMYDFIPDPIQECAVFDEDVYMANIFKAKNNCCMRFIGLETANSDTDVEFGVYLLDDDAKTPVDGTLFAESKAHFTYAGYHSVDIGKAAYILAGMKYSVVVKAGNGGKSELIYSSCLSESGKAYYEREDEKTIYAEAVVNPGESFVGTDDAWTDWTEIIGKVGALNAEMNDNGFVYDNLPIRSYPQTEIITIENWSTREGKGLSEGDIIEGTVTVTNNIGIDYPESDEFEIVLSLGNIGDNNNGAKFNGLKAGETKTINYRYTVTAADVKAGKIESSVYLKLDGEPFDTYAIFEGALTYTVQTAGDTNPATGTDAPVAMAV